MFILLIRGIAGSKLGPKAIHPDRDLLVIFLSHHHHHHHHHHHKHQGLDALIRSVSRVTTVLANVSSVFQLFFFLVVCSDMISKGFGLVAFFASVIFLSLFRKYGDSRPISKEATTTFTFFPINSELLSCQSMLPNLRH